MPVSRPRSAMRKIREVLRLSLADGLNRRQVGAAIESILKRGLDRQPLPDTAPAGPTRRHENVRGATYYE